MFKQTFSFAGTLLLAAALTLATPGLSSAQRGASRGGHFGGAHFGGAHFGGGRFAHFGPFGAGPFRDGFRGGVFPGSRYGYGHYFPYYGGYGYPYPYYGLYGAYPFYDGYLPYASGNANVYGDSVPAYGYGGYAYGGTASGQPVTDETKRTEPATLFGLPADNGRLQWPLGLRILPPADETKALRGQLELALSFAAMQTSEGQMNSAVIDEGLDAVRKLRQRLRPRKGTMADATYADAMQFLNRAERELTRIDKTGGGSPYP